MLGIPFRTSNPSRGLALIAGTIDSHEAGDLEKRVVRAVNLNDSYAWCRRLTRHSRSNFYFSFFTLPRDLFCDLCVLYAFMRTSDDLGDDATISVHERSLSIDRWRTQVASSLAGEPSDHPILPALADVVRRRMIPREYLFDVIDGVESDLTPRTLDTFAELSDYCYHVAGAVGLCCIHIWGFCDPRAKSLAVDCGLAFQLTNILRDVADDARVGRYYVPREDLERFGVTIDGLRTGQPGAQFRELMAWEAARARTYFARAQELIPLCSPAGRTVLDSMLRTYATLLSAIEQSSFNVHSRRIKVGRVRKLGIVLGSLLRHWRVGP